MFSRDDSSFAVILRPRSWVNVFNAASGELINFFGLEAGRADVDLSADGARVLIANGPTVRIMDVITGVELERFTAPDAIRPRRSGRTSAWWSPATSMDACGCGTRRAGAEVAEYAGHSGSRLGRGARRQRAAARHARRTARRSCSSARPALLPPEATGCFAAAGGVRVSM